MYKRILIVGDAGRGKSTFASKLSLKTGIPHYSTDDFYWKERPFVAHEREISEAMAKEKFSEDSWIIEGTTQWLVRHGLDKADIIIHMYFKSIFAQLFYILKRHFQRKDEPMGSTLHLLKHVFYKRYNLGYKKGAVTHREILLPYSEKVIEVTSFRQAHVFLDKFDLSK
mgnify:CR=1 FL=1